LDILAYLPEFGNVLWTALAFVVALSVIVAVHEYGHYIVGRWSGIHADVFSLGFGPVIYSRVDKRGTKWQLALLPFGGYVKFFGDANAASGKDGETMSDLSPEDMRRSMHGAPLWARTATVLAGPVFNFILSILIFSAVMLSRGQVSDPLTVGEMRPLPYAVQELRAGDEILSIAGSELPAFDDAAAFGDFTKNIPKENVVDYGVRRDGREIIVQGPYPYPPLVTQLSPQSAAMATGMQVGDVIIGVDGADVFDFDQLKTRVEGSDGAALQLDVWRNDQVLALVLTPRRVDEPQGDGSFVTNWRIGIAGGLIFEPATQTPGLGEALWRGVTQTGQIIRGSLSGLYHMVTGAISSCNMSGPIGIAQVSGQMASQGAQSFIWFIAVLSTAVGLLNLFPVPVLDGGHLVFYAYEAVVGKPPSDTALRILMTVGLVLILSLMVFALSNDLFCP